MLLAAILLLSPIPQNWDSARTLEFPVISSESTRNSSLSQPLPSLPEPKVKTDAEAADGGGGWLPASIIHAEPVQPANAPRSFGPMRSAGTRAYEASATQRKLWYALTLIGSGVRLVP
jgi:hypothetical protein